MRKSLIHHRSGLPEPRVCDGRLFFQPGQPTLTYVDCGVGVPVVCSATSTARPGAHAQARQPLGAASLVAVAALLGGESFVDFFEPGACVIAFVPKHGSERAPARIQHGLCHVGFSEARRAYVADEDGAMLCNKRRGVFVQKVFSAVTDFLVDGAGALHLVGPLRHRQLGLQVPVELRRGHTAAVGVGRQAFEPQVKGECARGQGDPDSRLFSDLDAHVEVPAAPAVFADAAGAELVVRQAVAVPQGELQALKLHLAALVGQRTCLKGNPAQAAIGAVGVGDAPGELHFARLAALLRELFANLLEHGRANAQACLGRAVGVRSEIKAAHKAALTLPDLVAQVVGVVPDEIDFAGHRAQGASVLVFDAHAQHARCQAGVGLLRSGWFGRGLFGHFWCSQKF